MSLKEYSDAASKGDQEKAVHKQRRRSKKFLKLFISLTTLLSVVRGENQSLMQFLGVNVLVGASIASSSIQQSSTEIIFDDDRKSSQKSYSSIYLTSKYTAEQSSTLNEKNDANNYNSAYSASLAVDGNFSTCSSTKETTDPRWWKLTMGQTQLQIKGVSIRLSPELKDSFQEFTIFVIDVSPSNRQSFIRCNHFSGHFPADKSVMIECINNDSIGGHKVYIRDDRTGSRKLQLCEVQVYGPSSARPICEEPGEIENGEVTVINGSPDHLAKNEIIYDTKMKYVGKSRAMELQQLEYKCNKGYMLWGNSRIECQYNNSWTSPPPTCQPISCGLPPSIPNTESKMLRNTKGSQKAHMTSNKAIGTPMKSVSEMGDVVKYECINDFVMELNRTEGNNDIVNHVKAICTNEGTWQMDAGFTCRNGTVVNVVGPSMNDDLNRDAASLFFVWHTIMYLLIAMIAILLCFPLVYCCCYRKYRQRKVRRRKETEVTMPRLIDTSSFHEQNEPGVKQLQLILSKGDNDKRFSNGGTLQSIITEATSCGSSKNSLTSMQIQSSQNHQNTLKLVSPAASPDDCNPISYNSDNISPLTNSVTLANKVELKALKEAENDNEIRIPENGNLIRGFSVDETDSSANVELAAMSANKVIDRKSNSNFSTLNSPTRKNADSSSQLRSVNSPVPFPPPSISLPDTPSMQNQNGHDDGNNRVIEARQMQADLRMSHNQLFPNQFPYHPQNGSNIPQHAYLSHGGNTHPMMIHSSTIPHPSHRSDSWQMLPPRRTNSTENISFSNENIRYHNQNSLPVHFFNTIGHVNHHTNSYHYKDHLSVPYNVVNDNQNFNQHPFQMMSSSHSQPQQSYPMRFDSILKAPANFRDSALYSNDPTDPMFSYHVAQQIAEGNNGLQPALVVDQGQHPSSYLYQPSYTNIPGRKQEHDSAQDWPIIDEAGYASLIRKNGKTSSMNRVPDEPVYEKIQETHDIRETNENLECFESDSGTSSGLASSLNNRADNFIGQAYYQNFEDAVREVQRMANTPSKDKVPIGPKPPQTHLEPDILQSSSNRVKQSNLKNDKNLNTQQPQNIYANDGLEPQETKGNSMRSPLILRVSSDNSSEPEQIYARVNMAAKTNNISKENLNAKTDSIEKITKAKKLLTDLEEKLLNGSNSNETSNEEETILVEHTGLNTGMVDKNDEKSGPKNDSIDLEDANITISRQPENDDKNDKNQESDPNMEHSARTVALQFDEVLSDVDVEYL